MMHEDESTTETIRESVEVVVDEAWKMSAIIDDFVVVSRVTNQLLTFAPKTFSLIPEIQKTLLAIRSNEIDLRVEGSADIQVHADHDLVRQIIRILTTNAIEHADAVVKVSVGNDASTTWIDVIDDGPGLPQGVKSLFDASSHPNSESGQPEHLGRGLFVANRLAQAMEFDLTYSRQDGKTVIRLLIPTRSTTHPSRVDHLGRHAAVA